MKINISLPQEISQYGKSPSFRASVIAKDSNNLINISNSIPVKTLYLVGCRIRSAPLHGAQRDVLWFKTCMCI